MGILTGSCGTNVTYHYNTNTSVMTISGTGAMDDYSSRNNQPWYSYYSYITQVVVEDGVTHIGNYAFEQCSKVQWVTFKGNITSIGQRAFYKTADGLGVTFLGNTTAPTLGNLCLSCKSNAQGRTYIFHKGWATSSLINTSIAYKNTLYAIASASGTWTNGTSGSGNWTINDSGVLTVTGTGVIPDNFTSSGISSTYDMSWNTRIEIGEGITGIGASAFKGGSYAYNGSRVESISLPNTLVSIGDSAFQHLTCLKSIEIPNSVTSIGINCFNTCISLENIVIGKSVTNIGTWAFGYCSGCSTITFNCGTAPTIGDYSFAIRSSYYGTNTSTEMITVTVYTKGGWGSDTVFTQTVKGGSTSAKYTTFIYEKLVTVNVNVNVSGTWKPSLPYVNVNGTWKEVVGVYVNVNGTWKEAI